MWIGESVSNNRCGEGYRLTDRTRQTCLRITIAARFIRNGHAHRAMRVKFPARFFNYLDPLQRGDDTARALHYRPVAWRLSSAQAEVL